MHVPIPKRRLGIWSPQFEWALLDATQTVGDERVGQGGPALDHFFTASIASFVKNCG